ncbi:MAG: putative Ig domain-containing protein [Hydrogenothermaceae bacterium]|nr:putative Ig domain-containing protein [Hydrogenothermaceae bacterium]
MSRKKAFSLLEMALVLVIMGVILSGGVTLFNILYKRSKISQAEELINSVYESLISLSTSSLCLEVPVDTNERSANILPPQIQQRQDPFLKYVRFFYSQELTPPTCNISNTQNNICGRRRTNFAMEICKDENCSQKDIINNVAFVLVSGGWNKNIQIDNNIQVQVQEDTNNDGILETVNKTGIRIHYPYSKNKDGYNHATAPYYDPNRPEEFDDIVKYITLQQLQSKLQCENAKLRITTDNLPNVYQNMQYMAYVYADGGIPFASGGKYKWTYTSGLPSEFTLSPSSGNREDSLSISKSATSSACPGTYTLNVTAEDSDGNKVSKTFSLTVLPEQLKVNPDRVTFNPIVGKVFSQSVNLNLSGGKATYTCNISGGNSYNGLTLSYNDSTKTATISGTPTDAGSTSFRIICDDSCPIPSKQSVELLLTVLITCDQLKVLPDRSNWNAAMGGVFNLDIPLTISGGKSPYSCSPSGATTCNGLTFFCNSTKATIFGIPTAAGNCNFTCSCTDSCSGGTQTVSAVYSVAISSASSGGGGGGSTGATCSFNYSPIPTPAGTQAGVTISITGGPANVTFSPTSGTCTTFYNVNSLTCTTAYLNQNLHMTAYLSSSNSCSPTTLGKICVARNEYRVWNTTGQTRDFHTPNGTCRTVNNNSEITQNGNRLAAGQTIRGYTSNNGTCSGTQMGYVDHSWASCIDDNGNGLIDFNADGSTSDR